MSHVTKSKLRKPTLEDMERAMVVLVTTLVAHRNRNMPSPVFKDTEIMDVFDVLRDQDHWTVLRMREDIRDPVEQALKKHMNVIGWWIWRETKDLDKMRDIAERICDLDPAHWSARMSPIDSAWNGIGDETGKWWS